MLLVFILKTELLFSTDCFVLEQKSFKNSTDFISVLKTSRSVNLQILDNLHYAALKDLRKLSRYYKYECSENVCLCL